MNAVNPVDVLNRLLVVHHRSLVAYLRYASPTWHRGDDRIQETLQTIAADQQHFVDRLGEMIVDQDGAVQFGSFPMAFTGYHDLSADFLLNRLLEHQRRDIRTMEACVSQLDGHPLAKALAQEALGAAKGHLESLEETKRGAADVDA